MVYDTGGLLQGKLYIGYDSMDRAVYIRSQMLSV